MLKELKKFAKNSPIYLTSDSDNKKYAYAYNGNTIAYYELDKNIDINNNWSIPSTVKYENIEEVLSKENLLSVDETPFDFTFDSESETSKISSNNFIKVISQFKKFYNVDDYRTELTGLHIRKGSMFASDSVILRLRKTNSFPKSANLIVDINPWVEYVGVDAKKIKSVSNPLFASKKVSNVSISLSIVNKDGDDALKIKSDKLSFIIISIGESKVKFNLIKKMKPTHKITLHKDTLIKNLTHLLDNPSLDSDAVKEYVKFNLDGELKLSNYIFYKDSDSVTMNCKTTFLKSPNEPLQFVLNANKLLTILKIISDSQIEIHYENEGMVTRVTSPNTSDLLLLAQTTYK